MTTIYQRADAKKNTYKICKYQLLFKSFAKNLHLTNSSSQFCVKIEFLNYMFVYCKLMFQMKSYVEQNVIQREETL